MNRRTNTSTTRGRVVLNKLHKNKQRNYNNHLLYLQSNGLLPDISSYYQNELEKFRPVSKLQAMALCPFHNEKNSSFSINLKTGMFFCHACSEGGGGIIKFHMKKHNLSYKEAIASLKGGNK